MTMYVRDPMVPAKMSVIWMHGLGSSADDLVAVADQYPLSFVPARHVFINAPMRPVTLNNGMRMQAWYDILGFESTDKQDKQGILESAVLINKAITEQVNQGFDYHQIFLAGFSQGAAMALYAGLHAPYPIGGIISLSGYLPLVTECNPTIDKQTPIFIGLGKYDTVVLPNWTQMSANWLEMAGFKQVSCHEYPVEHTICPEEVIDILSWLGLRLKAIEERL